MLTKGNSIEGFECRPDGRPGFTRKYTVCPRGTRLSVEALAAYID